MHFSLSSPNLLACRPNLTLDPLGRVVIPRALEPPKFWQKWEVFMTLGERLKHMEYAARLGYRPCQMQPFRGEARGKGALSQACSLGPRSPRPHFHFSRCQPPSQATKGSPMESYLLSLCLAEPELTNLMEYQI